MKIIKITALSLVLLLAFAQQLFVFAEESVDSTEPDHDYYVAYGYSPLVASDGTKASRYITVAIPPIPICLA